VSFIRRDFPEKRLCRERSSGSLQHWRVATCCTSENAPLFDKHLGVSRKRAFFETTPFSPRTTHSDCIAGFELLTAGGVRDITSTLSWRPVSTGNGYGAKLPENPANIALSGRKGL
jgi:hypothetical protein